MSTSKKSKLQKPTEIAVQMSAGSFFMLATNEKVFMKKGEFGTRPPITGAGFCSKVELLPTAS
jgi:hypothetical protein